MSIWHEVKSIDKIDITEDGEEIHINIGSDYSGAIYVSVPVKMIEKVLGVK
jgi:hypothetical protein